MMIGGLLADLRSSWSRLARCQRELASGRRLLEPADDPAAVMRALSLRSELGRVNRYVANADEARNWIEITDMALAQAGDVVQRVRELTVSTVGTVPLSTLQAARSEVSRLLEQLVQVGNTCYGDRYIFSGQRTLTPAFVPSGEDAARWYQGDDGPIWREVGPGIVVQVNRPGSGAMKQAMVAVQQYLEALEKAIESGQPVPGEVLSDLDGALDALLEERAHVGADGQRLDMIRSRLQDTVYQLTNLLSETEDADLAEVMVRLAASEAAYRAALEAGARIVQPSLLEFLR